MHESRVIRLCGQKPSWRWCADRNQLTSRKIEAISLFYSQNSWMDSNKELLFVAGWGGGSLLSGLFHLGAAGPANLVTRVVATTQKMTALPSQNTAIALGGTSMPWVAVGRLAEIARPRAVVVGVVQVGVRGGLREFKRVSQGGTLGPASGEVNLQDQRRQGQKMISPTKSEEFW